VIYSYNKTNEIH